jgi:hypothetical protein
LQQLFEELRAFRLRDCTQILLDAWPLTRLPSVLEVITESVHLLPE